MCKEPAMDTTEYDRLVLLSFGICIFAFMVIVALHLMGLHICLREFRRRFHIRDAAKLQFYHTMILILSAMMLLFALHMVTNFCWGYFIYLEGATPNFREGVYYSLENYTGLGLTRVDVADRWRMLAPMISLSGVFCLSWSTAVLVSFFGQIYKVRLDQ
jgi:hypothetical protein